MLRSIASSLRQRRTTPTLCLFRKNITQCHTLNPYDSVTLDKNRYYKYEIKDENNIPEFPNTLDKDCIEISQSEFYSLASKRNDYDELEESIYIKKYTI